jgi:hypothetical protein
MQFYSGPLMHFLSGVDTFVVWRSRLLQNMLKMSTATIDSANKPVCLSPKLSPCSDD